MALTEAEELELLELEEEEAMSASNQNAQPQPSFLDQALDASKSIARTAVRGVAGLADMGPGLINLAQYGEEKLTGKPQQYLPMPATMLANKYLETSQIATEAEGGIGRTTEAAGSGMISGAPFGAPGMVAGAVGGGAANIAKELGGDIGAQLLASLLGGVTPTKLAPNIKVAKTVETFKRANTMPTVGQATGGTISRAIESTLQKIPGGYEGLHSKGKSQQAEIGGGVERLASNIAGKTSAERTGAVIEKNISDKSDPTSFMSRSRATQKKLYSSLDNYVDPASAVGVKNFKEELTKMASPIEGAENLSTSGLLTNKTVSDLLANLEKDLVNDPTAVKIFEEYGGFKTESVKQADKSRIPYVALKKVRSKIGEKIEDAALDPNINHQELRRLYGALSKDMEAAAKEAGPEAFKAYSRANKYTKAYHDRLDVLQTVIERSGGPEKIYQAATSGVAEGATTFRSVMRSLTPENRRTLSATVLRRLGKATPGNQNDIGTEFSTQTFLTNWGRLSKEAKDTLAMPMSSQYKKDLDAIANVASNIRQGSGIYANPSGTTSGMYSAGAMISFAGAAATGNIPTALIILGGVTAAYSGARLMSSPAFVNWLARSGSIKSAASMKTHLAALNAIQKNQPEISGDIEEYRKAIEEEMNKEATNDRRK